jgi:hypothetical protein
MRAVLAGAIAFLAALGASAEAAGGAPAAPPSVFEERSGAPARPGASDPALRQRFLGEYAGAPAAGRRPILERWVPTLGVPGILDAFEAQYPNCHDHAHELGKAAYAVTHDMPGVLRACLTRCVSGCMHGVLMEAFTENPGTLRARIATLCDGDAFREIHKRRSTRRGTASTGWATAPRT